MTNIALSQGFCEESGFSNLEDDKTRVADAAYRFAAFDIPYDIVYRTRTLKDPNYIILHACGRSICPKPGVRLCLTWYACNKEYIKGTGTKLGLN